MESELSREDIRDMLGGWFVKIDAIQGKMRDDFPGMAYQEQRFWEVDTKLKEIYIAMNCAEFDNPREKNPTQRPRKRRNDLLEAHITNSKKKRIDLLHQRARNQGGDGDRKQSARVDDEEDISNEAAQISIPTIKKRPLLKRPTPKPEPRRLPDDISEDNDVTINIFSYQEDPKHRLGANHQPRHHHINKAKLTSKSAIVAQVLADKKGKWIHADDDRIVWDPIMSNRVKKFADREAIVYLDGLLASKYIVREEWWTADGLEYTAAQIWAGLMAFVHWVENGEVLEGLEMVDAKAAIQVASALGADEMYQYELAARYTPEAVETEERSCVIRLRQNA